MPLPKQKPSDVLRESNMYFSLESGESQLAATVDYVGSDHFVYASDIPHWEQRVPREPAPSQDHPDLSDEVKEKILRKNAKRLFDLN